ncbi:GntR family transcriptional regulator [Nonomuraea sp. NPDC049695]|uniref:GntR family transcriptional regulator n=1 Tax=Nonomuraea sp. NPDC049695 TaxID=3154734 RepID=UPI003419097C
MRVGGGMADENLYEVIATALMEGIESGKYPPGSPLPSEADLRQQYGATPTTIRRALQVLEIAGLTRGERGRGVYVRFYERAEVDGGTAAGGVLEAGAPVLVSIVQPGQRLAELMPGVTSLVRRRSGADAGVTSFYPRRLVDLVPELGEPVPLTERDETLLARAGVTITSRRAEVIARMPTRRESGRLGLTPSTPLLEELVVLADAEGTVHVVREALYPGDRYRLALELR